MKKLYMFILISVGIVSAQIPKTLSYQGVLTNTDGKALNGKHQVVFSFYESPEGGKTIWQESHSLLITEGFFEAILGSIKPLKIPFDKPYWLGIAIGESEELSPRIRLNAAPYSMLAQTVSDSSITKSKIADKQVVKSINSITDDLVIAAGENIRITQRGDSLIISAIPKKLTADGKTSDISTTDCSTSDGVKSLNELSGNLKLKVSGGANIYEKGDDTIIIEAGRGNIKEIKSTDSSLVIEDPRGKYTKIDIRQGGVSESHLADYSVSTLKIAANAVTSFAIKDSTILSEDLAEHSVNSINLMDNAVTRNKVYQGAIDSTRLADDAVITSKIKDGAVTQDKIDAAVSLPPGGTAGGDLAGTYPNPTLKDAAVSSDKIADGTITTVDVANDAITGAKIANGTVSQSDIADNAVTTTKIADQAITQAKLDPSVSLPAGGPAGGDLEGNFPNPSIKAAAVNSLKIADGAVTEADIADGSVTGAKIANGTVSQSDLADNSVTTIKIADQAITQAKLDPAISFPASGTAGGDLEGTYPNPTLKAAVVNSSKIADGSIVEIDLSDNAVSGAKIADGTIGTGDLANNAVNAAKIAAGSVVKSLNNLRDDITLAAGANINITQSGNILTFSSNPALTDNDWTIAGNNLYSGVSGNVGIGITNPTQKLDVAGTVKMSGMQLMPGAADGYVLTSDAAGAASWQPLPLSGLSGSGTAGYIPVFDSPNSITNSLIYDSGQRIGIGTNVPFAKLDVNSTTDVYTARFLSERLSLSTHVVHAEYSGPAGNSNVIAVYGKAEPNDAFGYGGYFQAGRFGVSGFVYPSGSSSYIGSRGYVNGGSGYNYGVHGFATGQNNNYGNYGYAYGSSASSTNIGVYGIASGLGTNYAGYFAGTMYANRIEGAVKNFKIDHPMDPENKYLYHSSIESSEMLNMYNGNVTLDKNGEAWINLPDWFEAINKDFRYQLTCVGGFAQVYIAEKISNNRFKIAGGRLGLEVSWQVTGVRNDPVAVMNQMQVVQDKAASERGKYLDPAAYGKPESMGIGYEARKQFEEDSKDIREIRNQ